jgi:LysR family cys regulon transcriptional activator
LHVNHIVTLQQLKALCEIAERGLNFSRAAVALNTTQPAISRMIRSLEQELGVELLVRSGKTMLRLTPEGEEAVTRARTVLLEIGTLSGIGAAQKHPRSGEIKIATTHTQASYGLVEPIRIFKSRYPQVALHMQHGTPGDIAQWVSKGYVDLGVNARPQNVPDNVVTLEAYRIERCIVAPPGHPILGVRRPTARDLARYPMIDYDEGAQTAALLRALFVNAGVAPHISVTGTDATAVMAYAEAGIGIAILQKQIFERTRTRRLRAIDASHLFPESRTMIFVRRNARPPSFVYELIELISPHWKRQEVDKLLHGTQALHRKPLSAPQASNGRR